MWLCFALIVDSKTLERLMALARQHGMTVITGRCALLSSSEQAVAASAPVITIHPSIYAFIHLCIYACLIKCSALTGAGIPQLARQLREALHSSRSRSAHEQLDDDGDGDEAEAEGQGAVEIIKEAPRGGPSRRRSRRAVSRRAGR